MLTFMETFADWPEFKLYCSQVFDVGNSMDQEFAKIEQYQNKGDAMSYEEGYEWLKLL